MSTLHSPPSDPHAAAPIAVGFVSLGCAKNLVDSQIMASTLLSEGMLLAPRPEEADVVVVNTCAFIEEAREESVDAILSACRLKEEGACRAVVVAGCLPQRYRHSLADSLPEVDAFIGLDELDCVGEVIRLLGTGQHGTVRVSGTPRRLFEPGSPTVVFTGGPFAYLKIAEGCDHRCSFCAIPAIRGALRSRPAEAIVREAEGLLEQGFRELNLVSQDTTAYGRDLGDPVGLPHLLKALGGIGGEFWIRFLYGYPSGVTDALLDAMNEIPQVCPYLDIPVQHSHPEILRAMKRRETAESLRGLVEGARATVAGITLRTTCLVGFPGETEEHFRHLLTFIGDMRFDHVGVFTFSPEEETPAAERAGQVPPGTAAKRRARLLAAQQETVRLRAGQLVGREADLLLERPDRETPDFWIGRTQRQAPDVDGETLVSGVQAGRRSGDFLRVRYTGVSDYDLLAEQTGPKNR